MLNRRFGKKELIILLVFVVLLLGLLYYQFVYKWIQGQKKALNTSAIEDEIMIEETKAARIKAMQEEIDNGIKSDSGVVVSYNNLKAEINELNDIFKDAVDFDFGFDQAVAEGDAVRRNINASFTAYSYEDAKKMLVDMHDCKYRNLIKDINVSAVSIGNMRASDANLNQGPVRVSFTVTFFETMYGADTTDGLAIKSAPEAQSSSELLDSLSASKEAAENM